MRGQREADLVPPVDEDVRVVVGVLGRLGHAVDERHRGREVLHLPLADDLVALALPGAVRQPLADLGVTQQCHTLSPVRIVSLVPSATELLFALGLGSEVIAVTHECDYPPEAADLPPITYSVIPEGLPPAEIDARVRALTEAGEAIYGLDEELLAELEPDLIVTQALCAVCAVSYEDVRAIATRIETKPKVISLDPTTFGEVLADVRTLATATDSVEAGVDLIARTAARIDQVREAVREAPPVRVAALEWMDPVFVAGHWTPQLIEYAGGIDVLGLPGEHSAQRSWEEVAAAEPEVVVAMPCGYDAARSWEEALDYRERLASVGAREVVAVDAAAYFSRPGPRLVDGLELLAHTLHPDLVPPGASEALPVPLSA